MISKALRSLGQHVAAQGDARVDAAPPSERTRQALAERVAQRIGPRLSPRQRLAPAAVAALIGVAAGLAVSAGVLFRSEPLAFTIGDAARPGVLHAWESAPADAKLPIRFSDGTELNLEPRARAQVVRVGDNGADVVLDSGRARFDVVPRENGSWRVRSGPFTIAVKGTRFDVSWDPKADEFTLKLFEGKVLVTGCSFGDGRVVEQGQAVRGSCGRESSPPAAAPGPTQAPDTAATAAPEVRAKSPVLSANALASESWQELARGGYFRRAYEIAAQAGFEAECQQANADDALLLGDAARLSGRSEHARFAYTTVRSRFAGSDAAARAAFALGRLAFDGGNPAAAVPWFEAYLAQRPSGPLAPSALDRLLEASLRLGDSERTRTIAKAYLAKNPSGPHAKDARRILGAPQSEH